METRRKCCDNTMNTVHDGTYLSDNEHAEAVTVVPTNERCSNSLSKNSHMRTDDSGDILQAGMKRACSINIAMPAENEKKTAKPDETAVARERTCKHVSMATGSRGHSN
jgi:hypothetical protein